MDITQPEGRAIVQQLAAEADVLLENYKVGGLKNTGWTTPPSRPSTRAWCIARSPALARPAPTPAAPATTTLLLQGMSGLMSITGPADGEPHKGGRGRHRPIYWPVRQQRHLRRLLARERSGEGQAIDLALFDCAGHAGQYQYELAGGR